MKVYSCPDEIPEPVTDYRNFDLKKMQADEDAHRAKLKAWLIAKGFTGPNTGKELAIPHADGAALYMYADAKRGACLIHLPYGDAWNSPHAAYMPKAEVLRRIKASDGLAKLFAEARAKKTA